MHTCHTCSVQFSSFDAQKDHMKTDWHRYNCKRKVESLKSISLKEFNDKLSKVIPQQTVKVEKQRDPQVMHPPKVITITEVDCLFCSRSFKNDKE